MSDQTKVVRGCSWTKIDRIWDLVLALDESDDVTGRISYDKDGEGRMSVTLDGRRVGIYIIGGEE